MRASKTKHYIPAAVEAFSTVYIYHIANGLHMRIFSPTRYPRLCVSLVSFISAFVSLFDDCCNIEVTGRLRVIETKQGVPARLLNLAQRSISMRLGQCLMHACTAAREYLTCLVCKYDQPETLVSCVSFPWHETSNCFALRILLYTKRCKRNMVRSKLRTGIAREHQRHSFVCPLNRSLNGKLIVPYRLSQAFPNIGITCGICGLIIKYPC